MGTTYTILAKLTACYKVNDINIIPLKQTQDEIEGLINDYRIDIDKISNDIGLLKRHAVHLHCHGDKPRAIEALKSKKLKERERDEMIKAKDALETQLSLGKTMERTEKTQQVLSHHTKHMSKQLTDDIVDNVADTMEEMRSNISKQNELQDALSERMYPMDAEDISEYNLMKELDDLVELYGEQQPFQMKPTAIRTVEYNPLNMRAVHFTDELPDPPVETPRTSPRRKRRNNPRKIQKKKEEETKEKNK